MPGCCSIAIYDSQALHVGSFGLADMEYGTPMRTDSIFRLYCLTKPMVAVGLMVLVERGKCQLDDDVSLHLPEFGGIKVCASPKGLSASVRDRPLERKLTLRRLLTHSSGLGYGAVLGMDPAGPAEAAYNEVVRRCDGGDIKSLEELSKAIAALPLRFQPGEKYLYSYGLDIVGRAIEVISGKRLDRFLREEVLDPCGMKDTGFGVPLRAAKERLVALYASPEDKRRLGEALAPGTVRHKSVLGTLVRIDGSKPTDSAWVESRSCPVFSGGGIMGQNRGGMVSTLADQACFYLMLLRGGRLGPGRRRILKPATVEAMWASDWLTKKSVVGHPCRDQRKLFGWHALGEIGIVKRTQQQHYPDFFELGEWGMAGAAMTHVTVVPHRKLLCLWFTSSLEGWPGWKAPEQNLWKAARLVALRDSAAGRRRSRKRAAESTTQARPVAKRRRC